MFLTILSEGSAVIEAGTVSLCCWACDKEAWGCVCVCVCVSALCMRTLVSFSLRVCRSVKAGMHVNLLRADWSKHALIH